MPPGRSRAFRAGCDGIPPEVPEYAVIDPTLGVVATYDDAGKASTHALRIRGGETQSLDPLTCGYDSDRSRWREDFDRYMCDQCYPEARSGFGLPEPVPSEGTGQEDDDEDAIPPSFRRPR